METPNSIKTDNDRAYTSRQFKQFLQSFSIQCITGIPYNPQAQGRVERAHQTLKLQIKKLKTGNTQEYFYLPYPEQILLDLNTIYSVIL